MKNTSFFPQNTLVFSSAERLYNFRTSIIVGACRSGKTTLGTLLGSCKHAENIEEPWPAKIIPLMNGLKMIDKKLSQGLFLNYVTEVCNETISFRTQSFKPSDISNIWQQKTTDEILRRLNTEISRKDVQMYIKKYNPLILLNLTEVLPFIKFIDETLKKPKIINVIRNGYEVAAECREKMWFSDEQLFKPIKALPYRIYNYDKKKYHIPWWVSPSDVKLFINYNNYERCLYYWYRNIHSSHKYLNVIKNRNYYRLVKYNEIIEDTNKVLDDMCNFLGLKITKNTIQIVKNINNRNNKIFKEEKVNYALRKKIDMLNNLYKI